MTFLVVGLVIGAAAGVGVGYVMFGGEDNNSEYWFYLDFNGEDTDVDDQWISVKESDALSALLKALDSKNIPYDIAETGATAGWITSIGDVEPKWADGKSWMLWGWFSNDIVAEKSAWSASPGLTVTNATTFYLAVSEIDSASIPGEYVTLFDPNYESVKWKAGGPFSA